MPKGNLKANDFAEDLLRKLFGDEFAVKYLYEYLKELSAVSLLIESHYIDRHYLEDYANYYARSFEAPSTACSRLHFFKAINAGELDRLISAAYENLEGLHRVESTLQEKYLGFVVQRPLIGARVGRTVLKTYPIDGRRQYRVLRTYNVNIAGLKLCIEGLAYQQQDRGAAVCASTALWSALQYVAHKAGHRTPTPCAITAAAKSPFPASHGLNDWQVAEAISALGYIADQFEPAENRLLFRAKLAASLNSQLPVILLISRKEKTGAGEITVGHAVTVTGYSEPETIEDIPSGVPGTILKMKAGSLKILYVHDDNLGSHAHYELIDSTELNSNGHLKLDLQRGFSDGDATKSWWETDVWTIEAALVPKPSKLRMPIENLLLDLVWLRKLFEAVLPGLNLSYDTRFESGVHYRRELIGKTQFDPSDMYRFQSELSLPRHIGLISVNVEESHLVDFVLDASEVDRNPRFPSVHAIVADGIPKSSFAALHLKKFALLIGDRPSIFSWRMPS